MNILILTMTYQNLWIHFLVTISTNNQTMKEFKKMVEYINKMKGGKASGAKSGGKTPKSASKGIKKY